MTREYSSISVETTLASGISSTQTSMTVALGTGASLLGGVVLNPNGSDQFTVAVDPDTINEEIIFISNVSGDTFTISRGEAGSSNISHSGGATVRHVLTSDDLIFFNNGVVNALTDSGINSKGDMIAGTGIQETGVLPVGTQGQILAVNSAEATGLKWVNNYSETIVVEDVATTTYTLSASDIGKLKTFTNAASVTVTVPSGIFATGAQINLLQNNIGQVTVSGSGVTIKSSLGPRLRTNGSAATLICIAPNVFLLSGDTQA
jgi:hypothetical protein